MQQRVVFFVVLLRALIFVEKAKGEKTRAKKKQQRQQQHQPYTQSNPIKTSVRVRKEQSIAISRKYASEQITSKTSIF